MKKEIEQRQLCIEMFQYIDGHTKFLDGGETYFEYYLDFLKLKGFTAESINEITKHLNKNGGYDDVEIMMNVEATEELELILQYLLPTRN